jgi:hypothetical protein
MGADPNVHSGPDMYLHILQKAWRQLDIVFNRFARGGRHGRQLGFNVRVRDENSGFSYLFKMWSCAGGHEPNRRTGVCGRKRQHIRRHRMLIPAGIIGKL